MSCLQYHTGGSGVRIPIEFSRRYHQFDELNGLNELNRARLEPRTTALALSLPGRHSRWRPLEAPSAAGRLLQLPPRVRVGVTGRQACAARGGTATDDGAACGPNESAFCALCVLMLRSGIAEV